MGRLLIVIPHHTLILGHYVLLYAPNSFHQSALSTSSSPACALVTREKLTFSEVSDDLITTKPKGQSNFQTSSFLHLFAAFVTFNHFLFLEMLSDLRPHLYLVEFGLLHFLHLLQSFFVTQERSEHFSICLSSLIQANI